MKLRLFTIVCFVSVISSSTLSQSLYFPPVTGDTWETTSPGQLQWQLPYIDTLYNYLEDNNTKAFLVLIDGKIVLEKYFGTFTKDSAWYWASAGKTLTSFSIGLAQQEGKLSIHDTSAKYLGQGWTSLPPGKEQAITIRHQLTMTTGLNDANGDPDCTNPGCLMYKADAGTRWAYHNAPYTLLDSVIIKASGQSLNSFIYQRLHNKTGFNGLYLRVDYNNVFFSTPRNMARFGLLLLNKGKWADEVIMQDTAYFRQMTHPSQAINNSYGYLTWLNGQSSYMIPQTQIVFPGYLAPAAPADMFAALGKNGQFINVIPSLNMVWVRMGDAPDNSLVPFLLNDRIWQKLNLVMGTTKVTDKAAGGGPMQPAGINLRAAPNPFNPACNISYTIEGGTAQVELTVYDSNGNKCRTLYSGEQSSGEHNTIWNGKDDNGVQLASGVYLCRVQAGAKQSTLKLLLIK
ncbi:MAG: serine hydrolase [Ignavibacteriales bacterium]|nr:serine hydrolase [Ignavibacteriales bacterium]